MQRQWISQQVSRRADGENQGGSRCDTQTTGAQMSKLTDDNHEAASKPVVTLTGPGETATPRTRRIPAIVDDGSLDEITRAVSLKLAMMLMMGKTTPEMYGAALAAIAREWTHTEMGHLGGRDR
jgi:hypothetical protein